MDLVWFREPWSYLHNYQSPVDISPDTFFTDDGQRGLRYSPFYGNSGFYYIKWSPRTEYWAWSVISSFETMHTSGSHQNVVTMRLMETMDMFNITTKILDVNEFPTGVKYHHDKPYMQKLKNHQIQPYHFHMCWTSNKEDKLKYFKNTAMWYVQESCEHEAVRPHGNVAMNILRLQANGFDRQKVLLSTCCQRMPGAP